MTRSKAPATRRYPRFTLDVDWFVESAAGSSMGRGLEVSVRGALLPVTCTSPFATEATLFLSLPMRETMFKARCSAKRSERGWLLTFEEVAPDDLQLLGHSLLGEFGAAAMPNLEKRPVTELEL